MGAGQLTQQIYRVLVEAAPRAMTAVEIFEAIKFEINYTATAQWWERAKERSPATRPRWAGSVEAPFDLTVHGPMRVADRIANLTYQGVVCSEGGRPTRYTSGRRAPKGFEYRPPGPFGWRDIDPAKQREQTAHAVAKINLIQRARAEVDKTRTSTHVLRALLIEAIEVIERM